MSPKNSTVHHIEFTKIRQTLWPIHGFEFKKFFSLSLLMFFILGIYTMIRDIKDSFFQYAPGGGTELIPYLKLFFVLPFSFIAVMIFSLLVNKFGTKKTFYIIVVFFMAFFAVFGFILYPNIVNISGSQETVDYLRNLLPKQFFHIIPCITNWPATLFYVFAEIWGTMAISSLFWQFANQITKKGEVKRFYAFLPLIANLGVILSGTTLTVMSEAKGSQFTKNVQILMLVMIVCGATALAIYHYINKFIMTDPKYYDPSEVQIPKPKAKVNMTEGIRILFKSPYLLLVSVLVLGYGIGINFTDIIWKTQMRAYSMIEAQQAINNGAIGTLSEIASSKYNSNMGKLSIFVGFFTIIVTFFSSYILRKFKWRTSALMTPVSILIFGVPFFAFVIFYYKVSTIENILFWSVAIGLVVDAIAKSLKYCLFDTTKSMAYIPLDPDEKTKGQAAVEVIGGRAGKAGASAVQVILTQGHTALVSGANLYIIIGVFVASLAAWIGAVFGTSVKYEEKVAEQHAESELG